MNAARPSAGPVRRATCVRVKGASTSTAGKGTDQAKAQELIHVARNSGGRPMARGMAMPETRQDISPSTIRLKGTGANLAGIIGGSGRVRGASIPRPAPQVNGATRARPSRRDARGPC